MLLAGVIGGASACSPLPAEPVIAERESAAESFQTGDTGSQETEGAGITLAQQTEAPERYRTEVIGDYMELRAEAPVCVPGAASAPVRLVEAGAAYSEADFDRFKEAVQETEGAAWEENQFHQEADGGYESCTSRDGRYYVSFRDGSGEQAVPFLWLTQKTLSHGSRDGFDAWDTSGMIIGSGEKAALEETLEQKAERLLGLLGLEDFRLIRTRWKVLSKFEDSRWQTDGRYGLFLRYCRTSDGIPVPSNGGALLGEPSDRCQYVDFVYADDGELVELKDIGRERYLEEENVDGFLLPFSAVTQIFEQYCKTFYENAYQENPKSYDPLLDESQQSLLKADMRVCAYLTVTRAALEYRPVYEDKPDGSAETVGRLEPVWNFYGSAMIGYRNPDQSDSGITRAQLTAEEDTLIVSIRAGDGHVYGK